MSKLKNQANLSIGTYIPSIKLRHRWNTERIHDDASVVVTCVRYLL